MIAKTLSAAVIGIDAHPVEIEVSITNRSTPGGPDAPVTIVGLPDAAVKESRDRIRSAVLSSGFPPLRGSTIVNLAPADLRKEGTCFDLGMALTMLAAAGLMPAEPLMQCAVLGELSLDGTVRPVRGVLPSAARVAAESRIRMLLLPAANAEEAALAAGDRLEIQPVETLRDAIECLTGTPRPPFRASLNEYFSRTPGHLPDFAEVKGQSTARRALEIAAAGGHNILMSGPPGTGKSMLANRLPGILPPMTMAETLETSRIYSVLGLLTREQPLLTHRPFRAPHHTVSDVGLIGGGRDPHPGEISLAHNGVLFLDELPEFKRNVLEVLRQPLEDGVITVSRAAGTYSFPARFILCAAMNPCPCGRGAVELGCTCRLEEIRRYQKKISGPLLDRIDLQVEVRQLSENELLAAPDGESSATIRQRVERARRLQQRRFEKLHFHSNSQMTSRELQTFCRLSDSGQKLLRQAIARFKLSPRAYDRILKVARTIADLGGSEPLREEHLFEAITYRRTESSAPPL